MTEPKWITDASRFLDGRFALIGRKPPVDCNADLARQLLAHLREVRAALRAELPCVTPYVGECNGCGHSRSCCVLEETEPPKIDGSAT